MRRSLLLTGGGLLLILIIVTAAVSLRSSEPIQAATSAIEAVYSEFGQTQSHIWAADPAQPQQRRLLATIQHTEGYGLSAAIDPLNSRLAYLMLAGGAPETDAQLWLLDLTTGNRRQIGRGFDLLSPVRWSGDGQQIAVRRQILQPDGTLQAELVVVTTGDSPLARPILADPDGLWIAPIDWSPGGEVYYARLSESGTDIGAVGATSGQVRFIAHASDGVARDFQLSLTGDRILFTAPLANQAGATHVVATAATNGSGVTTVKSGVNDHFHATWGRDGVSVLYNAGDPKAGLNTGVASVRPGAHLEMMVAPGPSSGFDLPISWSPDESFLAIRVVQGTSSYDVHSEKLVTLNVANGLRQDLPANGQAQFIGWLLHAQ